MRRQYMPCAVDQQEIGLGAAAIDAQKDIHRDGTQG
jgi:hypothetical protein